MLTAFIKFGDGKISRATDTETLHQAMRDPAARFWLDMSCPTDAEYALLKDVFGFHPLAIEDSVKYMQRPKIEPYANGGDASHNPYWYMVIHGPDLETFREDLRTKELDIFVSEKYLLTSHDERFKSIDDVIPRCANNPGFVLDNGIDMLLYTILDHLVDNYQPILNFLQEELDTLEEAAVECAEPALLPRIAAKKRDLLNLRRLMGPQRDVLAQLTRGEVPFIRESTRVYLRDVLDHLTRATEMVELYRDLVVGARDIYMSSISNNLNEIMKTLTTISVIALPLTVVTGFFGMNFEAMPGIHSPQGFWIAMVIMGGLVAVLLYWFRTRRWI
jgi:magnesium transporter